VFDKTSDMNKSTNFSGIPVIKQVLKYILLIDIFRTKKSIKATNIIKGLRPTTISCLRQWVTQIEKVELKTFVHQLKLNYI
jgi:hypothetical protein